MGISPDTLKILVCPQCKGEVEFDDEEIHQALICHHCSLAYPLINEIPIMLIDRAHNLDPVEGA